MIVTDNDVKVISSVLGDATHTDGRTLLWTIRDSQANITLAITLTWGIELSDGDGASSAPSDRSFTVVSAQTSQGYLELHDVTAYLCIEPDEVMFIAKRDDRFSSLVVGQSGTCSQFSNINPSIIKADLTAIDPTLLMAAMQLSLAEMLLESLP
ncbi:MAG: hypothetical protein HYX66_04185 [Ignavibacteria bacterium]|nr:hypothetical protein [Ignavibacteria bacterium]